MISDVAEFEVGILARPDQQGERLITGDLVPLHQDAFGLADKITRFHGLE
jgi:hypothetical protein